MFIILIKRNVLPYRNERISPCNLSINPLKIIKKIKDRGNKNPHEKKFEMYQTKDLQF